MKVLIIGGTSFIGPPLVRRLVDLGNTVASSTEARHGPSFRPQLSRFSGTVEISSSTRRRSTASAPRSWWT